MAAAALSTRCVLACSSGSTVSSRSNSAGRKHSDREVVTRKAQCVWGVHRSPSLRGGQRPRGWPRPDRGSWLCASAEAEGGAADDTADLPPGEEDYDPNDFAVSDEPVPDDILETLASSQGPGTAGTPDFAAITVPYDGVGALPSPDAAEIELEEKRRDLKLTIVDSLFGLERGFRASSEGRAEIAELVSQLEALNPSPNPTETASLLRGRWLLAYTSFSELLPLLAASLLPLVSVGDIVQDVDTDSATVTNSVTFVGPFSSSTFDATATFEIRSPKRIQIKFQEGILSPPKAVDSSSPSSSGLPSSLELFGQTLDLASLTQAVQPLRDAAASLLGVLSGLPPLRVQLGSVGAQSWLLTTYLDEDIRVSRGDGGGLFVLVKEGSPFQ